MEGGGSVLADVGTEEHPRWQGQHGHGLRGRKQGSSA